MTSVTLTVPHSVLVFLRDTAWSSHVPEPLTDCPAYYGPDGRILPHTVTLDRAAARTLRAHAADFRYLQFGSVSNQGVFVDDPEWFNDIPLELNGGTLVLHEAGVRRLERRLWKLITDIDHAEEAWVASDRLAI